MIRLLHTGAPISKSNQMGIDDMMHMNRRSQSNRQDVCYGKERRPKKLCTPRRLLLRVNSQPVSRTLITHLITQTRTSKFQGLGRQTTNEQPHKQARSREQNNNRSTTSSQDVCVCMRERNIDASRNSKSIASRALPLPAHTHDTRHAACPFLACLQTRFENALWSLRLEFLPFHLTTI